MVSGISEIVLLFLSAPLAVFLPSFYRNCIFSYILHSNLQKSVNLLLCVEYFRFCSFCLFRKLLSFFFLCASRLVGIRLPTAPPWKPFRQAGTHTTSRYVPPAHPDMALPTAIHNAALSSEEEIGKRREKGYTCFGQLLQIGWRHVTDSFMLR